MNTERGWFGFFIVLALTMNFGFVMGDLDNHVFHNKWELGGAFIVSVIATILKLGDRSAMGAVFLATSLVADFHMAIAIMVWLWFGITVGGDPTPSVMAGICWRTLLRWRYYCTKPLMLDADYSTNTDKAIGI